MLCSAKELGWGDDHSGIVELDPSLPLGKSLCDIATNSDILDVKTPSNRWDYLSYIGLAREISANLTDNSLVEPATPEKTYQNREVVKVKNKGECRAFYTARLKIKNNATSPKWLVDNLIASGMRSINPVVDITNFVMLEYGQPSHAYDAKKLKGPIGVRFATSAESLQLLDGSVARLNEKDLVIVDNSGPIGLAGVMGGASTETSIDTREIVLEVANFDKTTVRRSALRHGLRSEASARFEKGLPLPLPHHAMNRLVDLLVEVCGAELIGSPTGQIYSSLHNRFLGMRLRKAERFLGYKLDEKQVMEAFAKRGFKPSHFSFTKEIRLLDKRTSDIKLSAAEIIYEKAGLGAMLKEKAIRDSGMSVPPTALKAGDLLLHKGAAGAVFVGNAKAIGWDEKKKSLSVKKLTDFTKSGGVEFRRYVENFNHIISVEVPWWREDVSAEVDLFEEVAKSVGYEAMPETLPALLPSDTAGHQLLPSLMKLRTRLSGAGLDEVMTYSFVSQKDLELSMVDEKKCLRIENPLNSEQDYLRSDMLASHLHAVAKNQRYEAAAYEISRVYEKLGKSASEKWMLSFVVWGEDSLLRLKGAIDIVLQAYDLDVDIRRELNSKRFISSRSAVIGAGLGSFGQLNKAVLNNFDIQCEVSWAQLDIVEAMKAEKPNKIEEPAAYQLINKDLSLEVDNLVTFYEVRQKLSGLVREVTFISEFVSEALKKDGRKRISLGLTMDMGPNPTGEQIRGLLQNCANKVQEIPGAQVL